MPNILATPSEMTGRLRASVLEEHALPIAAQRVGAVKSCRRCPSVCPNTDNRI